MKLFLFILCSWVTSFSLAQNVGIGNPTPAEKLDVSGNVNITGTIKANGIAGQNGQVLMSTGAGLTWGSTAGYKKSKSYSGSGTFLVPAGVTEIMVEAWGAGSGGTLTCGGTSGGYARTVRAVNPADVINITVGAGSAWAATTTFNGGNTTVAFGANVLTALGGGGIPSADRHGDVRSGSSSGLFDNTYFLYGTSGKVNYSTGFLKNATTYVEFFQYGTGGTSVGFINPPVIEGDVRRLENGVLVTIIFGQNSQFPSSGGSAGGIGGGYFGAAGFVVIWWN